MPFSSRAQSLSNDWGDTGSSSLLPDEACPRFGVRALTDLKGSWGSLWVREHLRGSQGPQWRVDGVLGLVFGVLGVRGFGLLGASGF